MFKVHATRLIRKAGIRLAAVVKDLRPISIIPPLAKVVEKLWYWKLYPLIVSRLRPDQFGGLQGVGVDNEICELVTELLEHNDKKAGNVSVAAVLDFAAAFDRVDHAFVVEEMIRLGVPDFMGPLLAEYLSGRSLVISWQGLRSRSFPLRGGVGQGSVLSILLFISATDLLRASLHNSSDTWMIQFW